MPRSPSRPLPHTLLTLALAALSLVGGPASAQAPVLIDDVDWVLWERVRSKAFGPNGLLAFVEEDEVSVWDTTARRRLARLTHSFGPPENGALATVIHHVAFTLDGRLVLGTSRGLEVISLRDTRLRQVLRMDAGETLVMESAADGLVVGFSSGDVVRYGGTPLVERTRFQLPRDARVGSIALVGERTFVAAAGRLFVHSAGALSEVPMGGTGARRDLAVGAGRAGEIIVAGGSHLARISAQSHAVLGTGTSEAGQTYQLSIRCNPTTQLCYWTRGARVEVWRDDLSARVASGDLAGIVDPGTGRALQFVPQTANLLPGQVGLFVMASSLAGPWAPIGARLDEVSDVAWSSRAGELLVGIGDRPYAMRLADLTLTAMGDARTPVAVASDGRVLTSGPLGQVIVHSAELVPQRTIFASTCNSTRIAQLARVGSEVAWEQSTRLQRQCEDSAPFRFATSPSGTLLAMDTPNGDLRWLDYQRARWLDSVTNFSGLGDDAEVDSLVWPAGSDAVEARVNEVRFTVQRSGGVTQTADASDLPSALGPAPAGGSPALSARVVDGTLVLRRLADGAELTLRFLFADPTPHPIARVGERFWAAPDVQGLVHVQASPFDLLSAELPRDSAFDPQLVTSFLASSR